MKKIVVTLAVLFLSGTIAMAQTQKPVEKKEPVKTTTMKQEAAKPVAGQKTANVQTKSQSVATQGVIKAEPAKAAQASTATKAVVHKHHKKAHQASGVSTAKSTPIAAPATKTAPAKDVKNTSNAQPIKK